MYSSFDFLDLIWIHKIILKKKKLNRDAGKPQNLKGTSKIVCFRSKIILDVRF